ncbi:MAG: fumarylacetoacetate hydrolase family protein [Paraburkholderia fungorum]|nr:fumarylacetoacetate hydrolase family protein [Paraburkholderia fungorum]
MKFASVCHNGVNHAVLVDGGSVIPLRGIAEIGPQTPGDLLRDPPLDDKCRLDISDVIFRPVVPGPAKVICVGLNYREHIAECEQATPAYPVFFSKFASSLIGPYDDITLPPETHRLDYEAELAVVIGKECRRVSAREASAYVAGYTVANDITMRDFQFRTHQWMAGKAWDRSTPLGPFLVTPDEAGDPQKLEIRLMVDGDVRQESSTGLMIYSVAELISILSEFTSLSAGDVILTGTPSGVGDRRTPPAYLQDGATVSVEISGIGRIENRVRNEFPVRRTTVETV